MGIKTLDHDPVQLGKLAAQVLLNRMENPSQSDFVTKNMKLSLKNPTLKNVVNHA
jgi:DNA-binding LacI/PurR family transcriptional regulator